MKHKPGSKLSVWKIDLAMSLVVIVGFELIDSSIDKLEGVPLYSEYLVSAKWLLIGGFAAHGLINWLSSRRS